MPAQRLPKQRLPKRGAMSSRMRIRRQGSYIIRSALFIRSRVRKFSSLQGNPSRSSAWGLLYWFGAGLYRAFER